MRSTFPINPQSTTPLREALLFAGLTMILTWLFWVPGSAMTGLLGDMLLGIGSFAPLAIAIFLDIWLQKNSLHPLEWWKTISLRAVAIAVLTPVFILMPVLMLRFNQSTLQIGKL